jgi:hypothetical protein
MFEMIWVPLSLGTIDRAVQVGGVFDPAASGLGDGTLAVLNRLETGWTPRAPAAAVS